MINKSKQILLIFSSWVDLRGIKILRTTFTYPLYIWVIRHVTYTYMSVWEASLVSQQEGNNVRVCCQFSILSMQLLLNCRLWLSKETDGMMWQSSTYCFIYLFLSNTGKLLNYIVIASKSSLLAEKMEEKTHLSLMKKK